MARKQTPRPPSRELNKVELESAIQTINRRITDLKEFDVSKIKERWDARIDGLRMKVNASLADIFGEDTAEYRRHAIGALDDLPLSLGSSRKYTLQDIQASVKNEVEGAVVRLNSLLELLSERLEDAREFAMPGKLIPAQVMSDRVFVVHGRDDAARESTARFIKQLELEPIILHEQPNAGRTIIEKLEDHLDVAFAVILLTPDDIGGIATQDPLHY